MEQAKPYSIIHYTTGDKPWNTTSSLRDRETWWAYRELEYGEILIHSSLPSNEIPNKRATFFTFTNDENIKHLYELARDLPQYEFNVGAYTLMGSKLIQALKYPNVHLYPSMTQHTKKRMLEKTDAYLDINYGSKDQDILNQFKARHIPFISFDEVATDNLRDQATYHVFENDDLKGIEKFIQNIKH